MTQQKDGRRVLAGRYEINERLGTGGMADVHLGRDRVLGRTIAVKTLLHQFAADPSFIARFRREAQAAAQLNHPQIVGVYDTGSDDGTHFIVMEYIDGKTLRDVIREEGPLLPERAAEIAADVCAALAFAHQHGIVHRDVKPGNIMLTKSGSIKVTDFGIARAMTGETVTQTAAVLGTAQYFSPEQAQAAPVDARSDIYSLGVVLYEMLTRQVPFTGSSPVAIAYKHVKEDPLPPSRLNPDVPPPIEAIVMKALAKNPDNRYQSAQEMRADLQRAIQGKPVEATPLLYAPIEKTGFVPAASDETVVLKGRPVPPAVRAERERKRRTGVVLLTLILLAIGGVAAWALLGGPGKPATISTPPVIGQKLEDAKAALKKKGLNADVVAFSPSDKYQPGQVSDQDPKPGDPIAKGGTVRLTVATPPNAVPVPDLTGKTQEDADKILKAAKLVLGTVDHAFSDTVPKGKIISQNPDPKIPVQPGSPVSIVVSDGKETATVPDVVGRTEPDARFAIVSRGLEVKEVSETTGPSCDQPDGRVCKQDPPAGQVVPKGTTVTITIALAPSPSPSPSPSPTGTSTLPLAMPFLLVMPAPARRRRSGRGSS